MHAAWRFSKRPDGLCLRDVFVFLQLYSVLVLCLYQQNSGLLPFVNKHLLLLLVDGCTTASYMELSRELSLPLF